MITEICMSCDYLQDNCVMVFDVEYGEIALCHECNERSEGNDYTTK